MATAPGAYVNITAASSSPNGNTSTGTWFVTGLTAMGPTGVAVPITSLNDYTNFLGARVPYGVLYDSLDEYFHDGGVLAYVSRLVGPSAVKAVVTLSDTTNPTLTVTANGAGIWGNQATGGLSVTVATGSVANSYTLTILLNGVVVLVSPNLFTPADAPLWFAAQPAWKTYVTIANLGSVTAAPNNNPANGTFNLISGADDNASVVDTQFTAGLTAFTDQYGSGQVSAPGHTTEAGYAALSAHATTFNRVPLFDDADTPTTATIVTQATTFQAAVSDPSYGALLAPWVVIPGIPSTTGGTASPITTRTVPPSALVAALMARNDVTNDANIPAAGVAHGQSRYAINVTQTYVSADRATLNNAGVNVIRVLNGVVTLYGYRSLALDPQWLFLNNVRFRMQLKQGLQDIARGFVFDQIDAQGHVFSTLNGDLAGYLQNFWLLGSLFGLTAQAAFTVNTGPQVNTPTTIAAGQIVAECAVRMAPEAEQVIINVVKYLTTSNLPVL
jgi:hypothetical protein